MIRKPSPGSSGSSRPASPSASGSGSSAGTKSGTKAGTRAGTAMGTRVGFTTDTGIAEPAGGAVMAMHRPKPKPALVGLAIAGWATFAVQWIVVLVIILGRGGGTNNVTVAQANTANRPVPQAATPAPQNPAPRTTTTTTTPRNTTTTPRNTTTTPRATTPTPTPSPRATNPNPTPAPAAADRNNPFLALSPNALGMSLNPGHTAILLDAVDRSSEWFDDGKAGLIAGLTRPGNGQTISLFTIRDGQVGRFANNPFTPAPARLSPLTRFFNPITTQGSRGLGTGLDAAIQSGADEVIFITSRSTNWGGYLNTLESKLNTDGGKVKLHIVQVGDVSTELRGFVQGNKNNGRYTRITPQQLQTWRSAAQ
ncbi:MAG: hypothetical protein AAF911_13945 [Planctomycetota bacterium]